MNWLWISVAAYALLAVAATVDKLMMSGRISHPAVFAFFVSILNIAAVLLAPFGLTILPPVWLGISLLAGIVLSWAMLFMYTAVQQNDSTRVIPFLGGALPLITLVLAFIFLGERLRPHELVAFAFLVSATVLISVKFGKNQQPIVHIGNLLWSSVLFGISYFLTKLAFDAQGFFSVFVWSRVGLGIGGVSLLLPATYRQAIIASLRHRKPTRAATPGLFMFGQAAGASGIFLLNYAIKLGSVSLVNALQGLQQVFLFGSMSALYLLAPGMVSEKFSRRDIIQKLASIALVFAGLYSLAAW